MSRVLNGVITIIIMAGVSSPTFARNKNKNVKTEFSLKLEAEIEKKLEAQIKAERIRVAREDSTDLKNNVESSITTLDISKDAEVTGIKCQSIEKYVQYEGLTISDYKDKDLTGYLAILKTKLSDRLIAELITEVTNQETNFLSLRTKMGYKVSIKNRNPKQEFKHSLKVSEFHVCFADIRESSEGGEKSDLKFAVFVPTSIIDAGNDVLTLNDFGFSNKQLIKEKSESDAEATSGN
jgi:hypothetical protein